MHPVFSIIIPAYNLGHLVCDAINSCINQQNITFAEYEIIVINDGSTDDTYDYIEKYCFVENLTIINQVNMGLSATRNRGIDLAKGDYILFLDGDDWLSENALALLKEQLDETTLLVFPMVYYFNKDRQEKLGYHLSEKLYNRNEFLHETLGYSQFHIIPAPNKCYSRKVLMQRELRFISGILHEDNPFFIDIVYNYEQIKYIDAPIYYYRQNREGSITSTCSIKNYEGVRIGNQAIISITRNANRDINFLLANLLVFQVIGNYSKKEDRKKVFNDFRNIRMKKTLWALLFISTFRWKHTVRMLLLLIDPALLKFILKIL